MSSQLTIDGRYDLSEDVTSGEFDGMYRALDRTSGRHVSLRLISTKNTQSKVDHVARRLEFVTRLKHPNIADILDIGETTLQGKPVTYVVMPLPLGRSLAEFIRGQHGPLDVELAVDIAHQLAAGLQAAHSRRIIHRDLKPANIIVSDSGQAVITDFGLARIVSGDEAIGLADSLPYMAPELIVGSGISTAADIYSLGAISYELLTGKQPFARKTADETMKAILYDQAPNAGTFNPYVTTNFDSVLQRALAKRAADRYWRATDFGDDLKSAMLLANPSQEATEVQKLAGAAIGEWRITFHGDLEHLKPGDIQGILGEISRLSGDRSLKLTRVVLGSVIVVLEGSADGYKVIEHMVRSGKLTEILGLRIQDVQFQPMRDPNKTAGQSEQLACDGNTASCEAFISYSHKDDKLRNKLSNHLISLERQGVIDQWHDRKISAGKEWRGEIDQRIETSQLILLLVTPDFIASDYCYDQEMKRALERHERKESRVVPIILRPVDWHESPFGKLQALPKDGKPVTLWPNRDEAFNAIAQDLRRAASEIRAGMC